MMEWFCDIYHEMKYLELKLAWRANTLKNLMKSGRQVPGRYKILKMCQVKDKETKNSGSLNGDSNPGHENENSTFLLVSEFRKGMLRLCAYA